MKNLKLIAIFFLAVLCINAASANFVVRVSSEKNNILPWEEASFVLSVQNKGKEADTLIYTYPDQIEWSLITDPVYVERAIHPNETLKTLIRAKPTSENIFPRQYNLEVSIASKQAGWSDTATLSVFIKDKRYVEYMPNVNVVVVLPESLDPRNNATLSVGLKNLIPLNLSDYTIEILSEVNPENNKKVALPLASLGTAEERFTLKYDDLQEPMTDHITILASIPSKNFSADPIIKEVRILPYSKVNQEVSVEESFLKKVTAVSFYNDGNVAANAPYKVRTSFLHGIFTSSEPTKPTYAVESGSKYLVWDNLVRPRQTTKITITTNYMPLFVWSIVLLLLCVLYFLLRSPVVIMKETKSLGKGSAEDGISRLKVLLHIKNRTGRVISDIVLIDRVPHIGTVEKEYAVGTLQPTSIARHDSKSTIIKWQFESLEPYEERIITYIIDAKLLIIGNMTLSHATIRYKNRRGSISKTNSNGVVVE
jgi:hypothetical protein